MKEHHFIGIGASAGGLEALKELLPSLANNKEYIYIIAQHAAPNKESHLRDILSSYTKMPVLDILEEQIFIPNTIYVIPPAHNLICKNAKLLLEEAYAPPHHPSPSVDKLFDALAECTTKRSVGIILSGTGSDGSRGILTLKIAGDITIVQKTDDALYAGMPENAIKTGAIDYILPAKSIAQKLYSIIKQDTKPLLEIGGLLREKEHFDINKYKEGTISRRIQKRMLLTNTSSLDKYLSYIQSHPKELHLLYQNILIGVTNFFRDAQAFTELKEMLKKYLKDKPSNYSFRTWSVGCSTGEEAYSLAILLDRLSKELKKELDFTIFATDIDEKALDIARKGCYSAKTLANLDADIIADYFIESKEGYKITQSLRSHIIFTIHNILQDPPLMHQDIISCRNLLIYIKHDMQEEVIKLFHSSLKKDGILFLGTSETILSQKQYFSPLINSTKIYKKNATIIPVKISSHYFSKHLQVTKQQIQSPASNSTKKIDIRENIVKAIENIFSKKVLIVDTDFSIIYKQGENPFLMLPDGYVTTYIIDNLHPDLRYHVLKLLKKVSRSLQVEETPFIEVILSKKQRHFVKILVTPLEQETQVPHFLLYFQEIAASEICFNPKSTNSALANDMHLLENFKEQIQTLKEDNNLLQSEATLSAERLQLLNEELQSSNEELQSANEELETSNEELQSSNEELHVAIENEQNTLKRLSLILKSTKDGILGIDMEGNHTFVNDAAITMFGYSEDELIGKNGHTLWHHTKKDGSNYKLEECTLHNHLIHANSYSGEDLFWRKDGTSFDVELSQNPIIQEGIVVGTVLSFSDITEQKVAQEKIKKEQKLADLYLNTFGAIVVMLDTEGRITNCNQEAANIFKVPKAQLLGQNFIKNYIPKEMQSEITQLFEAFVNETPPDEKYHINHIIDAKGDKHLIRWTNNYIQDKDGNVTAILSSGVDITKEQELNQKLYNQEHLYKLTFEEADVGIAHVSLDGKWIDTNTYLSQLLGYTKEEFQNSSVSELTYMQDRIHDEQMKEQLLEHLQPSYHTEKRYIKKDGSILWASVNVVLLRDATEEPLYFLKIIRDISEIKLLMYSLEAQKNKFEKIIEFAPLPILIYDEDKNIILINNVFRQTLGYELSEIPTLDTFLHKAYKGLKIADYKQITNYYEHPERTKQVQQSIRTKNGSLRVELLNAVSVQEDLKDEKTLYMISMLDITDLQKKDELMLAQSRQAAMGDMLSMIAHQWRQPLSVISMIANNIQMDIALSNEIQPENLKKFLDTVHTQTQYLSQTIDDFRDFFKPDKEKENTSLAMVVQKLQNLVEKSLEDNHILLEIKIQEEYPLFTYSNQLLQVLVNLINNAKDAINETRPKDPKITLTIKKKDEELFVNICDNGGGLKANIKNKIGEPYVTTKAQNGTGLGLYMSKIIMEKQLHGRLFWNCDTSGCCFSLALPIKEKK